ncbi:GW dipeptide domain-containing protein [Clostridium sp. Marseille-Q2269]|uniref:GW dipeptide domain-containing protein n=1 Tax=Clostridium sp. Marseille-Q2269 TaxID=2942205 RepID=UPI0020731624|nr:GW dipeptide domain-containing protein [Clostridium sp. Marseille-Q2269]
MIVFLLFILVLGASSYFIYTFSNKINLQQKQIVLLKRQIDKLKNKDKSDFKNIYIKFINSSVENGTIVKNSYIYLYPNNSSPYIYKLYNEDTVTIHCCAESSNDTWYEVSCFSKGMTNTRGWIKKDSIHINL